MRENFFGKEDSYQTVKCRSSEAMQCETVTGMLICCGNCGKVYTRNGAMLGIPYPDGS